MMMIPTYLVLFCFSLHIKLIYIVAGVDTINGANHSSTHNSAIHTSLHQCDEEDIESANDTKLHASPNMQLYSCVYSCCLDQDNKTESMTLITDTLNI